MGGFALPRAAASISAPTGKTADQENFPVASVLLAPALRGKVMAFYRFARFADDVADDPKLPAEDKLARLEALEQALAGRTLAGFVAPALALRQALDGDERLLDHAARLLQAFRRDALGECCHDWADLMAYCRFSAAPVGRFLLDLHGEDARGHAASDALCAALQVLNHLQDCAQDYGRLGRVYLPGNWLVSAGLSADVLADEASPPELRRVLDVVLDHVDGLLEMARPLPSLIRDRRLRLEAAVVVAMAERLSAALRRRDPLAEAVKLSPAATMAAFVTGLARGLG